MIPIIDTFKPNTTFFYTTEISEGLRYVERGKLDNRNSVDLYTNISPNSYLYECELLNKLYKMTDKYDVIQFVERNNHLIFALQALPKLVIQFFKKANLSLEIVNDVEEEETTLFLGICTPLSYQKAFDKKRELFKNSEFKKIMKNKEVSQLLSIGIENY